MKKIIAGLAALLLVGGAAAYLYFKGSDKHLQLIPKDAFIVASIDFKSLGQKASYEKLQQLDFMKELQKKNAEHPQDSATAAIMEVFKNPLSTGINLMSDVYFFGAKHGDEGFAGGMVVDIQSESKFEATVRKLSPKSEIISKGGYKLAYIQGVPLAWNSNGAIVGATDQMADNDKTVAWLDETFKRSRAESILGNAMFHKFDKGKKDLSFFVNGGELVEFGKRIPGGNRMTATAFSMAGDGYKDIYTWAYVNFGDDKISVTSHVEAPKGQDAKFEMLNKTGISANHQKLITPKNVYALLSTNINMDKLFAYYESIPMMKTYEVQAAQTIGMSVKEMQNAFSGELSIALVDVKKNDVPAQPVAAASPDEEDDFAPVHKAPALSPIIVLNFSSKNKEGLTKLLAQYTGGKNDNGFYSSPLPGGYLVCVAENKIGFTVTNDAEIAGTIASKGELGPLPSNVSDLVKDNAGAFYLDLTADDYPDAVKGALADAQQTNPQMGISMEYWKLFKDIRMTSNTRDSEIDLNFVKGEGNTLYRLFAQGDAVYKKMKPAAIQ